MRVVFNTGVHAPNVVVVIIIVVVIIVVIVVVAAPLLKGNEKQSKE